MQNSVSVAGEIRLVFVIKSVNLDLMSKNKLQICTKGIQINQVKNKELKEEELDKELSLMITSNQETRITSIMLFVLLVLILITVVIL